MKTTNLTKLLLAAALPGAAAFGVIPVTDNFGIRGYIDGSYSNLDEGNNPDVDRFRVDAADIDLLINTDKVSSEIHIASGVNGGTTSIEQAFLSLDLGGGFSVTAGKFESDLGFEGDEAYKLYQQSTAYTFGSDATSEYTNLNYIQGARASYVMDALSASVAVVDNAWGASGGDADELGFEAFVSYNAMQGLTIGVGTAQGDENNTADIDDLYNVWVQYNGFEDLILAAEYNNYEMKGGIDGDSWLIMGNYSFGNSVAATVRYSQVDEDNTFEGDKFTFSPSYSFTDNLLGVLEYSTGEQGAPNAQKDFDFFAAEAIFTF